MTHALFVLLAVAVGQEPKDCIKPGDDEDEVVAGLPDGDVPSLPERVQWDWTRALVAKTTKRERFDLSGFWRFAAVDEQAASVKRSEMGWIDMPTFPCADSDNVFDGRFRDADGLWRGKPLDKFPFLWIERDIRITNADALEWLSRRVFLVIEGPWTDSEIYASQRSVKRPANQDDEPDVYVHVEPVTGVERDGGRWCDITEQLIYPGNTQISLRFKRATAEQPEKPSSSKPHIRLERWPTGPRIDSIQLRRTGRSDAIEAKFFLERPQAYLIPGLPPVRTIPLSLEVRLETDSPHTVIAKKTEEIGPLEDLKRSITLTIPWRTPERTPQPTRMRLRTKLTMNDGRVFDEPFPIEFQLDELEESEDLKTER